MFKSYFFQFDPVLTPAMMRAQQTSNVAAMPEQTPVDVAALHNRAAAETPVDDGSGTVQVRGVSGYVRTAE